MGGVTVSRVTCVILARVLESSVLIFPALRKGGTLGES